MMYHHVFDEVPESEAAGKKLIRAKWRNDDRAVAFGSVAASFVRYTLGELAVAEGA